jgi:hypothetical protein
MRGFDNRWGMEVDAGRAARPPAFAGRADPDAMGVLRHLGLAIVIWAAAIAILQFAVTYFGWS